MKTETITYLKENANTLELQEELVITKKGKPAFVVQNYDHYQAQQEALALLKLLNLSERDIRQGHTMSIDEALEKLDALR
ncbi:MAG: type II toxin-antitoxin system Phd/YefM family antitoxin [Gammaproteobacteria bacterium]|jgi:PHD/YefM family antitoxin component YafN of YafNO toxin-antitoxin module|nr:type II toxin-antitoxin system Phd/YefM family antitoxin [Gammaproteobacteria bacterium]